MDMIKSLKKLVGKLLQARLPEKILKNRYLWIAAGGLIVVMLILILFLPGSSESKVQNSWTSVRKGDFEVTLVETGELEAVYQQVVNAPMMWGANLQVVDLVPEGTIVKKGDFLLQFDATSLEEQLDLAKDNLESLLADFDRLKSEQALTMKSLENNKDIAEYSYRQANLRLKMMEFESEAKRDEARLQLEQARINLEKIKKQIESQKIIAKNEIIKFKISITQAENRIRNIKDRIEEFTLRAPIDGMVVYMDVGSFGNQERLKKGYTARPREPLMSIPDLSKMQVKLYINEVDCQKIRKGLDARIVLDAYPDREFAGRVRDVARLAQEVNSTAGFFTISEGGLKGFLVYIDILDADPVLKPGMTARVDIILERLEDVLYIPVGTVYEIDGQPVVFQYGKHKPLAVYLGPRNDGFVVVRKGLKEGMKLGWVDPTGMASILGEKKEKMRIEKLRNVMSSSFEEFQKRGILYKYSGSKSSVSEKKRSIDLNKLPPSLRNRLKRKNSDDESKKSSQRDSR